MRSYKIVEHDKKRNQLVVELTSESGTRKRHFDATFLPSDPDELDQFFSDQLEYFEQAKAQEPEVADFEDLVGETRKLESKE